MIDRSRRLSREQRSRMIYTLIAILVAIPLLFPIYWIIVCSLKSDGEIFQKVQSFFPRNLILSTYVDQLTNAKTLLYMRNSFIIALSSMALSFCLAVSCAYGITRFKIYGKKLIIMTFLVTQMLPSSLLLTPMYITFLRLKVTNTFLPPILSTATISIPFIVLVLRPIFMALPKEIEEAAEIDGCGRFSAFLRIMMPIAKNGTVTALAFAFIYGWNDLIFSITFNNAEKVKPLTSMIYNYTTMYGFKWNYIMAYGVIIAFPVLVIFIFLQKYIIEGLVSGSVKG